MSILPSGTTATAPSVGAAAAPFDTATLHRWLEDAFGEFYNALFDAACASGSATAHDAVRELLRQTRLQQESIVEGACADIALLLADSRGGGVVVPISVAAGGDAHRQRSLQRRLLDVFARRCVRLPLDSEHRAALERAFHRRVIEPLEQLSAGGRSEAASAGAGAVAPPERAAESAERIERLISRFRAGGLKLTSGESADAAADELPVRPMESVARATAGRSRDASPGRARGWLMLATATALSGAVASGWHLAAPQAGPVAPQRTSVPAPAPASNRPAAVAPAPREIPVTVPTATAIAPSPTMPQPAQTAPVQAPPAATTSGTAAAAPALVPGTAPTRSPTEERLIEQVQFLMRRGDAALAELRLTEPFPDSAAANYLAVLAIDPAHAGARQGLERVVARYAALVRDARQRGDSVQAERLLARARSVLPQAPLLHELETDAGP